MQVPPPLDFHAMFADICGDNEDAKAVCWTLLQWVHWIDDTVDRDKPVPSAELIAKCNLDAALCFAFNNFWQAHREKLTPLLVQGVQAWEDSVAWSRRADVRERRASDVLKSLYGELFHHIAYILGGAERLRAVTAKWRAYNFDVND